MADTAEYRISYPARQPNRNGHYTDRTAPRTRTATSAAEALDMFRLSTCKCPVHHGTEDGGHYGYEHCPARDGDIYATSGRYA